MLYHKELGFPDSLRLPEEDAFFPAYSQHAQKAANTDRYGRIILPDEIKYVKSQIIEVETFDNKVPSKIIIRVPYKNKKGFDLVVAIDYATDLIKTVWLNKNSDKHTTLDEKKYTKN